MSDTQPMTNDTLILANKRRKDAWEKYDQYIDSWLDGRIVRDDEEQRRLCEAAVLAEHEYYSAKEVYDRNKYGKPQPI